MDMRIDKEHFELNLHPEKDYYVFLLVLLSSVEGEKIVHSSFCFPLVSSWK